MSISSLLRHIPGIHIKEKVLFSELTTFQLGGACDGLVICRSEEHIRQVIPCLIKQAKPFIVIGEGSNLLASDQAHDLVVVRYESQFSFFHHPDGLVTVNAGVSLDALCSWAVSEGKKGLNFASGIPGTVGGAVSGNAGAFGQQISDVIARVSVLTPNGEVIEHAPQSLGFRYRHSRFKETDEIITQVTFRLENENPSLLLKEREDILFKRQQRHPDYKHVPCAGSFFKNIESADPDEPRQAAGWFLDQVGAKQMSVGGAGVFNKHANIIVKKTNQCTAQDVFQLSQQMSEAVFERFFIRLIPEVRFIGSFGEEVYDDLSYPPYPPI